MNKIILKYILKNFFITFLYIVLIFYSFGILLNLFEEISFFKNEATNAGQRIGVKYAEVFEPVKWLNT